MTNIITVKNLNYSIPYGKEILKDVSFEVNAGEFVGILGRNGSGKTTLLDLLQGVRPVTNGILEVLGEKPIDGNRKKLREIAFLSHDAFIRNSLTIEQYFKFYSSLYDEYSKNEETRLMDFFSLSYNTKLGTLSTGQLKKAQFIATLSVKPKLLLIDEVTAVMDPETRDQFFKILHQHKVENNLSVVLATNIAEDLVGRADRVLFIEEGVSTIHKSTEILSLFKVDKAS